VRERTARGVLVAETRAETQPEEQDGHHGGDQDGDVRIVRETVPARVSPGSADSHDADRERSDERTAFSLGSAVRMAFGAIWLVDAYFKWQPSFLSGLPGIMHDGAVGQPGWLTPWFDFTRGVIALQPAMWAYVVAIVETCIALALVLGLARKVTYIGGALWSLAIWTTAEGFGRSGPGETATDAGTAIVYVIGFLALLAADRCWGTRRYSVDAAIERKIPAWSRIAEIHR
jgi:nitrite reductase (NO-forming)